MLRNIDPSAWTRTGAEDHTRDLSPIPIQGTGSPSPVGSGLAGLKAEEPHITVSSVVWGGYFFKIV